MAEQSPIGSSQVNDYIKKRQKSAGSPRKSDRARVVKRVSLSDEAPPARGLIRKSKPKPTRASSESPTRVLSRTPDRKKAAVKRVSPKAETQGTEGKPKVKIVTKTLPDGRVVKKRMVMKKVAKKEKELTPEEQEQLRLEEEKRAKEEAERKAEEERLRKEKEAEEERLRLEKEAEEKRLEEERIRLEREAEIKRIEEEKIRQETEKTRIYHKIEFCKGALSPEEQELAHKIADEMVKRNIAWKGYISLTSGIGGAILS